MKQSNTFNFKNIKIKDSTLKIKKIGKIEKIKNKIKNLKITIKKIK